jgi:5-methylcytosine-specific restriction endonuclease McrA
VKRAVWERDEGKCRWKLASGGICGSTRRLQLDHVIPRARGGLSTVENCRILCAVHNDLAAREVYGNAWMDRFTENPRARPRRGGRRRAPTTTAVPATVPA